VAIVDTCTGAAELNVLLLPSCPEPFAPQHFTVPFASSAHECAKPAVIATAPVTPGTSVGVAVFAPTCPS
jgi:hypothetical protein